MTRAQAAALALCEVAYVLRFPALVLFIWCAGYVLGWVNLFYAGR